MCFHLTFSVSFAASDDPLVRLRGRANLMKITSAGSAACVGLHGMCQLFHFRDVHQRREVGEFGKAVSYNSAFCPQTHTHTHAHKRARTHTRARARTHTNTRTHTHKHTHTHTHTNTHTVYLCVLCGSQNKQRLFPYTILTDWFL